MNDPVFILGVLAANVVLSELLVRRTFLKHLGTALLVIVVTAVTANLGLIPTATDGVPLYDTVFGEVAPLAIFWLLLQVNLRKVLKAGTAMISLFLIGSLGTTLGVFAGMQVVGGPDAFGEHYHVLGGMFVGTYTGGSVNFNSVALHYGFVKEGALYAGSAAVDSLMTTVWMAATLMIPRFLQRRNGGSEVRAEVITGEEDDTESLHPIDLSILIALGAGAIVLSRWIATESSQALTRWAGEERNVPDIIVLTTIALLAAQVPAIHRLRGTRTLGMFAVYVFLAVIGALCDVHALAETGRVGLDLLLFVTVLIAVHGVVVFGAGSLFRLDPDMAAVASQANIGGGTSALALARSLGRGDLVLPAILVGSIGTAIGTYLGLWTAGVLEP